MRKSIHRLIAVALFALFVAACAGLSLSTYGSFVPDRAVTQAFETNQMNPNLNYYISGSDVHPNAIMGLQKNYALAESLWKKVEMRPELLKKLVSGMQQRGSETGVTLWGLSMRDEQGREIGVWYSALFAPKFVKVGANNMVDVGRPDQHIYKEAEEDGQ